MSPVKCQPSKIAALRVGYSLPSLLLVLQAQCLLQELLLKCWLYDLKGLRPQQHVAPQQLCLERKAELVQQPLSSKGK